MTKHGPSNERVGISQLRKRVSESNTVTRNSEIRTGYIGTYESLFDIVDELDFEAKIDITNTDESHDDFVVTSIQFFGLDVADISELCDAVHGDLLHDIEYDEKTDTATATIRYD